MCQDYPAQKAEANPEQGHFKQTTLHNLNQKSLIKVIKCLLFPGENGVKTGDIREP